MKILHLTADWKWTGPAEPMLHAVRGLRARGHEVDVAFASAPEGESGGIEPQARERGLEPVHVLEPGQGYHPWRDRHEVRRLRELFVKGQYDLVHVHHTRDHLLAARALRRAPGKLVASWHHGEPIPHRVWNSWLFKPKTTQGLAMLSHRLADDARAWLGCEAGVVPGCVDDERFRPREKDIGLRAELGIEPGQRVVGLVARLQRHRRVDLLLNALVRALEDAPGLRLLVLGRGTYQDQVLTEPVKRLGLEAAVIHAGYRGADYLDTLALMDALVFLVPGSDGSCRAVLEGMSMEKPTIASRRGILPETVLDGETGQLVDEDPTALAKALVDLWREPERWQTRGKAARRRIQARHTIAAHVDALERLYERIKVPAT